jgi:hypothetical protein
MMLFTHSKICQVRRMAAWTMASAIGVAVLLLQFHVKQGVAWGAAGHLITCLIAEVNP